MGISVSLDTRIDQWIKQDAILSIGRHMANGKPTGTIVFTYRDINPSASDRTITLKMGKKEARWIVDQLLVILAELGDIG